MGDVGCRGDFWLCGGILKTALIFGLINNINITSVLEIVKTCHYVEQSNIFWQMLMF